MVTDLSPLVDSHCHLGFGAFDEDRDAVLTRAREAGVVAIVAVAVDCASARRARELCQNTTIRVVPTAGLHPTEASCGLKAEFDRLRELISGGAFAAIGETGLDAYHPTVPMQRQVHSLEWHLELALDHDLPVILHCRDAFELIRSVLSAYAGRHLRGVLHCFTGSAEDALALLELGLFIGAGGITTFRRATSLRDTLRQVPTSRLLVETDAPWLAPVPVRGRRNEPAFVAHVAAFLAADRGEEPAALAARTTANADGLFGLGLATLP